MTRTSEIIKIPFRCSRDHAYDPIVYSYTDENMNGPEEKDEISIWFYDIAANSSDCSQHSNLEKGSSDRMD